MLDLSSLQLSSVLIRSDLMHSNLSKVIRTSPATELSFFNVFNDRTLSFSF